MSERKIVMPYGMLDAVRQEYDELPFGLARGDITERLTLAALRWLSENPIVPTPAQAFELNADCAGQAGTQLVRSLVSTWQRRMFLAPEPELSPNAERIIQSMRGVTLSPADADAIMNKVAMVAHGWNPYAKQNPAK